MWGWSIILFLGLLLILLLILLVIILTFFPGLGLITSVTIWDEQTHEYPLLTETELPKVLETVNQLQDYRQKANSVLSWIGTAAYLEADPQSYREKAPMSNKYLKTALNPVYKKLRQTLQQYTGKRCKYAKWLARPGIHIFHGCLGRGWNVASLHVDLQYDQIAWKHPVDTTKTLSFTIPLQISPDCGLYMFNSRYPDPIWLPPYIWFNWVEHQKLNYRPGHVYIHDGHTYHMIAGFTSTKERITIQGHAIYCPSRDQYYLYW